MYAGGDSNNGYLSHRCSGSPGSNEDDTVRCAGHLKPPPS